MLRSTILRQTALARQAGCKSVAAPTGRRSYVVGADLYGKAFQEERQRVAEHAGHSAELWRKITTYVAVPLVVVLTVHIYNIEMAHAEHKEHLKEENGGEMPERVTYSYMNTRRKDFPWGVNTLFYNPEVNIPVEGSE